MSEEINTRNPKHFEIVGSKDLRESFKDGDRIRGSFFINNIEMHQFEANSPASVVHQINAKTASHFVHAEIDDGGHLVLVDHSGAPILIRSGAAYVDQAPVTTDGAAVAAVLALKKASEQDQDKGRANRILELLGLDSTEKETGENAVAPPGFETGRSAEEREKARKEAAGEIVQGNPNRAVGPSIDRSGATQIPSNPTPGSASSAGGRLDDGRGRSGTGGGSRETSAATIQDQHSGASQKPAPVPGA